MSKALLQKCSIQPSSCVGPHGRQVKRKNASGTGNARPERAEKGKTGRGYPAIRRVLVCSSERWPDYAKKSCRTVQYVPLFYRIQRPVLRTGLADRGSVTHLRNLLIDFNSACHELKRDQQALAGLHAAMQQRKLGGMPSREALLQLEVRLCSF